MTEAVIGTIAATLTTGAWLPQLYRTWRLRSARELSWLYLFTMGVGLGAWLAYGVLRDDTAIIAANCVSLTLVGALTGFKIHAELTHRRPRTLSACPEPVALQSDTERRSRAS